MEIDKSEIKKILFITLSNLGDIILTTPAFTALNKEFPEAKIDVVTGAPGRDVFSGHPAVGDIIVHKKKRSIFERIEELWNVRKNEYDVVVDLKNSFISYLSGAKYRSSFLTPPKGIHKKREHLNKVAFLGDKLAENETFYIHISEDERNGINEIMASAGPNRNVIINPGAKSHLKRWPAASYALLADGLISESNCNVYITGNEDDAEVVGEMLKNMKEKAKNILCKTSLGELAEAMKKADLVITNDSAPLHVASVVNTPTIAIFGPSDERKYGPLSEKSAVLKPKVPCRPCSRALCATGPDEGCISQVTVEEVYNAAVKMLNS